MPEQSELLRTVQSYLDREPATALCQNCWAIVSLYGNHDCDPEARAAAMVRALGNLAHDETARAKGYGVT